MTKVYRWKARHVPEWRRLRTSDAENTWLTRRDRQ